MLHLRPSKRPSLVLCHPNPIKPIIVEVDASTFTIGAIQMSMECYTFWHSTRQNSIPHEVNYPIYDKLYAIISTFEEWKPYLARTQHQVQVVIYHKISYMQTKPKASLLVQIT